MCSSGSAVGVQLRQFANGEAELDTLPDLLEERAALQCASLTEESIEGKHAIVTVSYTHLTLPTRRFV